MDNSNNQNQSRFLIAAILSMVVLFGWSYFFSPTPPPTSNTNTSTSSNSAPSPAPTQATQASPDPDTAALATTPENTPNRTFTIKSPLYEVTLDSRGALA